MPMRPITVKANFQLDTSAARAQLQGLQRELSSVTKGATMDLGITSQITEAIKNAQLLKQTLAEATDFSTGAFDLSKFNAAMKQQNMSIQDFKKSLQTLGPEGEKAFNSLATTIASAQVPLKRTSQGVSELMTAFGNTMRWQATSMAMHKIVGTFQQAFNYAKSLDKSLTNIQIVTGHNADYMRNFAIQANKAAQALSASTLEYTNASLIYYQQGLSDKEVTKRAETTLKLAKVTGESASKVSQQMTAVWNNFSNGVDNLERYADVMTALGATTASSSSEIAKGLEKFASVTKTIGLSYDYAASALATVTAQTRQSADSVGTAFKTLFSRLESLNLGETLDDNVTLNKYSEALLKVGVNVMDVNGHLKNMDNILDELGGRWNNLNKAQQVALAQTVGGVRNYTSLITLMDNWEDFQHNVTTAQLAEGTLQRQADIYAQSWEAAQQRVKTASQGIYDTLISSDFFKGFNNVLAGTLNQINNIGKTLGTGGSLAGLTNLFLGFRGDQVASKINDIGVNALGQTSFGQNLFKETKEKQITELRQEILRTGNTSAADRERILSSFTQDIESNYKPGTYKTKAEAQAMQNLVMQRSAQATTIMNDIINADQAKLLSEVSGGKLQELLIGQYGAKNTAKNIEQILNGQYTGTNGIVYTPGFRDYLGNIFEQNIRDLMGAQGLKDSGGNPIDTSVLQAKIQEQAKNVLDNPVLNNIVNKNSDLQIAFLDMAAGRFSKDALEGYLGAFKEYGISQEDIYKGFMQNAQNEFYTKNPNATDKEFETYKASIEADIQKRSAAMAQFFGSQQKTEDFTKGSFKEALEAQNNKNLNVGQSVVATGQMLSSVAMATNSLQNFTQSVKRGDATFAGLATTLGSVGIAGSQVLNVLSNKAVINGLEKFGLTTSKLGAYGLGIAAAGAVALGVYKVAQNNTLDAKVSRANEDKIAATAQAKSDKEKYDAFQQVVEAQNDQYGKLFSLQQGTAEYTSQLITSNAAARDIINTYNLKAGEDYSIDSRSGAINFSAEQVKAIDERFLQISRDSENRAQLANSAYTQLSLEQRDQQLIGQFNEIINPEGNAIGAQLKRNTQQELDDIKKERDSIALQQQADFQAALASTLSAQDNVSDAMRLAVDVLGMNAEEESKIYNKALQDAQAWGGETHTIFGGYKSLEELQGTYYEKFGTYASAEMDQAALASAIESKIVQESIIELINQTIKDNQLENTDLSEYANLTTLNNDAIVKLINEHGQEYQSLNTLVLNKQAQSQENLAQAILHNTNIQDINFREQARTIQETLKLSIDQTENLANYINNFGTNFGDNTGKAIYDALTTNGTQWNERFYEALQNISTSNSISSLADLTYQSTLSGNADLQASMESLRKAMLADIDDRGGLAKTLFSSSEFTKVFESLQDQYKATGQITAQNIADLAKKNEIIGDYMRASGSNEQTIADLMEMVSSGDIGVESITPALEHFVQNMNGAEGAQQDALDTLENYDFSDSITGLDKGYQNIGKVFYNARVNDVLYDQPVQEALDLLLTPTDRAKFERIMAIQAWGGSTKDIMSMIKEQMPEAYAALNELEGKGKKKGKGGGGFDTAIEYWSKMGLFEGSGIQIDESTGRITFGKDFQTGYEGKYGKDSQVTAQGFKDYVIDIFRNAGVSQEIAETWASQVTGTLSASSFGTLFNSGALIDSVQGLWGDLTGEQALGRNLTGEQINAIFNQYREIFARMKIEEGQLKELSLEELQDFEKNPGITDIGEWQEYIAEQARKNGVAIIDIKGKELLNGKSAAIIGQAIADNSMKTITESGISGLVQAAVMSGVQQYSDYYLTIGRPEQIGTSLDYDQLQQFYTNTLGLSTEDLTRHIDELNKEGTGVTHKWTDAYGVEHNLSSRGMTGTEFTQKIQHDTEVTQQIIDMQRQQWISSYISEHPEASYQEILDHVNAQEELQRQAAAAAAREGVQSSKISAPSPGEGTQVPPEGEEETPPEGEGEGASPTATGPTGLTAEQEAEMNDASRFVYQNEPLKEEIYKYWKWHGGTQAEAWDAVVKRGERAPVSEFPTNIGAVTGPSNAEMRKFLNANGYSNKDINLAIREGESLSDLYQQVQSRQAQQAKEQAQQTAANIAQGEDYNIAQNRITTFKAASTIAQNETVNNLPDRNSRIQALMSTRGYSRKEATDLIDGIKTAQDIDNDRKQQTDNRKYIEEHAAEYDAWINAGGSGDIDSFKQWQINEEQRIREQNEQAVWNANQAELARLDKEAEEKAAAEAAEKAAREAAKEGSAYWTANATEVHGPENAELIHWQQQQQLEKEAREAEEKAAAEAAEKEAAAKAERERAAAKEGSAYWTANATEVHGPENAELIHWQQQQQLEKEAREAAERIAAEQAAAEAKAAEEAAYLAGLNGQQLETAYLNGEITEEQFQNEAYRRAMIPTVQPVTPIEGVVGEKASSKVTTKKEEPTKEPTTKEMRDFLKENGYTNASINAAMREEGMSLKDLYQQVNNSLKENNKYAKITAENTGDTAKNTGDMAETKEEKEAKETQDRNTGKDTNKKDSDKDKDIFGNEGNTTIINEGGGEDSGSGDEGWWPGKPGGTNKNKLNFGITRNFDIDISGFLPGGKGGPGKSSGGGNKGSGGSDKGSGGDSKIDTKLYVHLASGQNNTRLLGYAKGKEGHIAVTGELGPELRVKSDGSMDLLGKTGREYTWVDPSDKIYTAAQTASIIGGNNSIPQLDALSKGINNFIPGYASPGEIVSGGASNDKGGSGSGGGGGSSSSRSRGGNSSSSEKDPRYDPQTLKIRDILERYYTILQQIDNITKAVERFSKVADRAWGRERIRAIEKQNEMQQKQYEAQKKYIAEIEDYLTTDQSALTTMIQEFVTGWNDAAKDKEDMEKLSWTGAEYDENGVLTNYREFVEKLVEQYNQKAASASQEDQYKFQEQLKDIQMYTDTLNLYEEQKNALEDIKNAILDTAIKTISYEVEYKLELSGDADRILNFQADKYKDDVYQAAKYLELLDQRADLTRQNLVAVQDGIFKTLGTYAGEAMRTGAMHNLEELGIYGTDQFKLDEELTDADEDETEEARIDRLKGISTKVNEWLEQLREKNADAAAEIDKMIEHSEEEGQKDIITNYEEVIRRLNQQIDYTMVRAKVDEWLEELRSKNAEAAAEIDKIVQRNADGEIINYTDVIERLNEENIRLSDEAIALLMEDQDAFFDWMSDFKDNPGWVDFTTEHKDLLTNYMDQIYQYLESLQDTYEQTIEQLGDSIKATSKQMDAAIDEFDYYGDVYKTFGNIIDLTNRHMTDVTQDFFNTLNSKSMDNNINKIKATVTNYHLLQNELAEVTKQYNEMQARANAATGEEQIYLQQSADKLKEQLDIANNQYEDAHKAFLSSWEDALSKMAENYKAAVEEASRNFEQGFSPLFNTLALLQAQFDREKALGDLYVDNYQRIHDLNKLNRDIQLSIDDTDNLKGKERLRDLQAEINQLQEDGTELSEYDLDILDKKYKLELARQALEDAKDAKSMVRLARDNNGNWSYVYTANQDDVDKAEQDYEDAIREMEQANEDYIDNIQDQILQVQQEAQQAILALQPEDFATYEDYLAAVNNIQNSMYQTLDFLRSQLNNAFGNNEWLDPYIVDRYGINNHDLTTDFGDTTLANLLDNPDVDKAIKKAKENFENNLKQPVLDAFIEYSERQDEVYNAAEHDIATIGKDFQNEMESIADSSEYQVEVVENLSQRVQNAFNDMAAVVDEKTKKHLDEVDDLVNKYEKLVEALTEVKRLSGENLPADMMQAIDTVDTWREIEDLENKLKENGHIRLLEDLVDIDREDVIYRSDKLTDATEQINKWLESLGDSAKDIAEAVERNDAGQITNYKDIVQKLSNIEKNDDNKATLKEIKKWKEKDDKAVLMDENQSLTKEGLWTYLMAGDEYTKQFLKDKIDNAAKNGAIDVGKDVDETEKAKVENYLKAHGIVYVKWDGGLEKFESMDDWLAWYEKHKYVAPSGGGDDGPTPWTVGGFSQNWLDANFSGGYLDTGGYTGRWQFADTGMYTGEWSNGSIRRNGRLAWLHQKELVLNAHDTENFLDAMEIVRQLDNLTNWMANGLGDLIIPKVTAESGELEQNVHIEAEFPNVTDHNEIEQAFNNLVNMASQYANRK